MLGLKLNHVSKRGPRNFEVHKQFILWTLIIIIKPNKISIKQIRSQALLSSACFSSNNIHFVLFWFDELIHFYSIYMSSINLEFHLIIITHIWVNIPLPLWIWRDSDIFKCIFFNENAWILITISLKFVSNGPFHNKSALVNVMACSLFGT